MEGQLLDLYDFAVLGRFKSTEVVTRRKLRDEAQLLVHHQTVQRVHGIL